MDGSIKSDASPLENAAAPTAVEPGPVDAPPSAAAPSPTFRQLLRDAYFTFDRRTLGFSRLMLGYYLIMDLLHRGRSWAEIYPSDGIAPANMPLSHASGILSLSDGFYWPGELRILWVILLVTFVCLF